MTDVLVSIRMPRSLLTKLKELVEKEHFMDVSEEVRSIVRQNWFKSKHPELLEIKKLRKEITSQIKKKSEKEIRKKVVEELEDIKNKVTQEQKNGV